MSIYLSKANIQVLVHGDLTDPRFGVKFHQQTHSTPTLLKSHTKWMKSHPRYYGEILECPREKV